MAVQDLAVGAAGFGAAVGVQDQGPAEPVDTDLVVVMTQQDQVAQAGRAAVGAVGDVVDLAAGGGLVAAAGPRAVPVAQDDRPAQVVRDPLDPADIEREGLAGVGGAELAGAQVAGQPEPNSSAETAAVSWG